MARRAQAPKPARTPRATLHAGPADVALGDAVAGLRRAKRLRQADLAQLLGWSTPRLARIEQGNVRIAVDDLIDIAAALKSSLLQIELAAGIAGKLPSAEDVIRSDGRLEPLEREMMLRYYTELVSSRETVTDRAPARSAGAARVRVRRAPRQSANG